MTPARTSLFAAALLSLAVGAGTATAAPDPAVHVRSGGVTVEDFAALNREAASNSFKLVLASKGSGAYLADVDVSVHALPSRRVVFEHRTEGPLLLAELPPGRYEVVAVYDAVRPGAPTRISRTVSIGRGLTQMVLYFDTGDVVSPDSAPAYRTAP